MAADSRLSVRLRNVCDSDPPTIYAGNQLSSEIMSGTSALQALYYTQITKITVCQRQDRQTGYHSYMIICIRPSDRAKLSGLSSVFARCERNTVNECHGGSGSTPGPTDTISFSLKHPKPDQVIMECTFKTLKVEHLADLLMIIHEIAPLYEKLSHDAWWFSTITLGVLQALRPEWTVRPSKSWVEKAIGALSTARTRGRSLRIAKVFAKQCNASQAGTYSMLTPQAWGVPIEPPPASAPRLGTHAVPSTPSVVSAPPKAVLTPASRAKVPPHQETVPTPPAGPKFSWSLTRFCVGDAVCSVQRLFELGSGELELAKSFSEPDLVMDLLQDALDDPSGRLGDIRSDALRLLQDMVSLTGQLPRRVKLQPVANKRLLSRGGEAQIFTGTLAGRRVVARDTWPPEGSDWTSPEGRRSLSAIHREVIALLQVQHPNILPILGTTSGVDHPLSIISPYAENGNSFDYLVAMERSERPTTFIRISISIASALYYLHTHEPPIIHGDVHARNIVVDDKGNALLCDFGVSRILHEVTRTNSNIVEGGKYRYLAPELVTDDEFRTSRASDCYSFAMAILEMATLERPFAEILRDLSVPPLAAAGRRPRRPKNGLGDLPTGAADALWALLSLMWAHDKEKRPSLDRVGTSLQTVQVLLSSAPLIPVTLPLLAAPLTTSAGDGT